VDVDATPPPPVDSLSIGISPNMTPDGDHIAVMDIEQTELVLAIKNQVESTKVGKT